MDRERAPNSDRRYALWGAVWTFVAAVFALLGLVQIAASAGTPVPLLAVGRLQSAYLTALLLGGVALPMAGAVLDAVGAAPRRLLWLWNGGIAIGVAVLLAGGLSGEAAVVAPWSAVLVAAAFGWWLTVAWNDVDTGSADSDGGSPAGSDGAVPGALIVPWQGLAVVAGTGAAASLLLLGPWLSMASSGAEQAAMRGVTSLGLVPAAWAAAVLATGARLNATSGRWTWIATAWWLPLAVVASARPLTPDLAAVWLGPLANVSAALAVIPAGAIALLLVASWRGSAGASADPQRMAAVTGAGADPQRMGAVTGSGAVRNRDTARAEPSGASAAAVAGTLLVTAAIAADGLLQGAARDAVRFTSWDGAGALFPPFAGLLLVAAASSARATATAAATAGEAQAVAAWRRRALVAAVATAVLGAGALWPVGLGEAAGGLAAATDRAQALARLAWVIAMGSFAVLQIVALRRADRAGAAATGATAAPVAELPLEDHSWPTRAGTAGYALTVIVAGLFLIFFVPAASSGRRRSAEVTAAVRTIDPALAATGRMIYARDGCAACHTQRVLAADAGRGWGPETDADTPAERAAAGGRRAGPDLAWVGDRYPTQGEMEARLRVHGPNGPAVPHTWLFRPSPTVSGAAVAAYLTSLRSGNEP